MGNKAKEKSAATAPEGDAQAVPDNGVPKQLNDAANWVATKYREYRNDIKGKINNADLNHDGVHDIEQFKAWLHEKRISDQYEQYSGIIRKAGHNVLQVTSKVAKDIGNQADGFLGKAKKFFGENTNAFGIAGVIAVLLGAFFGSGLLGALAFIGTLFVASAMGSDDKEGRQGFMSFRPKTNTPEGTEPGVAATPAQVTAKSVDKLTDTGVRGDVRKGQLWEEVTVSVKKNDKDETRVIRLLRDEDKVFAVGYLTKDKDGVADNLNGATPMGAKKEEVGATEPKVKPVASAAPTTPESKAENKTEKKQEESAKLDSDALSNESFSLEIKYKDGATRTMDGVIGADNKPIITQVFTKEKLAAIPEETLLEPLTLQPDKRITLDVTVKRNSEGKYDLKALQNELNNSPAKLESALKAIEKLSLPEGHIWASNEWTPANAKKILEKFPGDSVGGSPVNVPGKRELSVPGQTPA